MQKLDHAKTKLVPKLRLYWVVFGIVVALAISLAVLAYVLVPGATTLHAAGRNISLQIVRTPAAQAKGLGGRGSLPADQGMLFVGAGQALDCFWMKDMRFPLDIIWLDAHKKVAFIEPNVSPASYPKSFCPTQPASYVIELNAGQAAKLHIRTGQSLDF